MLWRTNGTPGGSRRLGVVGAYSLTDVSGTLFFGVKRWLYKSDGTGPGTIPIKDLGSLFDIAAADGRAFVMSGPGFPRKLWVSDGTRVGTTNLLNDDCPSEPASLGGVLYFANGAREPGTGACDVELWTSDGTPTGTSLVADLNATDSSAPAELTKVGPNLYFTADDGTHGRELWRYVP
jgi:ELWxxDGT repeat protein